MCGILLIWICLCSPAQGSPLVYVYLRQSMVDCALIPLVLFCHNLRVPYTICPLHVNSPFLRYALTHSNPQKRLLGKASCTQTLLILCLCGIGCHSYDCSSQVWRARTGLGAEMQKFFGVSEVLHIFLFFFPP